MRGAASTWCASSLEFHGLHVFKTINYYGDEVLKVCEAESVEAEVASQ